MKHDYSRDRHSPRHHAGSRRRTRGVRGSNPIGIVEELTIVEGQRVSKLPMTARVALLSHALYFVHQPVFEITTRRCVGVEALSRFADGTPPELWFDAPDQAELGVQWELTVLERALGVVRPLRESAWLSVNVSGATLASGLLPRRLADRGPQQVVLDLTQSPDPDRDALTDQAKLLRSQGANLAIDDFGVGFWGLKEVADLSPDFINLHWSLVTGIAEDTRRTELIRSLTRFANDMNIKVIAKGIEREADLGVLKSLGVHLGQGCLLCPPVDLATVLSLFEMLGAPDLDGRA